MIKLNEYETTFIFAPDADDAAKAKLKDRLKTILEEEFKGHIRKLDDWGRRTLAYPIRRHSQGYYQYLRHSSPPNAVAELERILRLQDHVIKFLTIKLDDASDLAEGAFTPTPTSSRVDRIRVDEDEDDDDFDPED